MSQVHVVHVMRTLGRSGGMERNMQRIVLALDKDGIRSSIVHLSDQPDRLEFPPHIPIFRVVTPPRDPRMISGIRRVLLQLRPTVIHARNWAAWPDTALARLLLLPPAPLVFSYHGMETSEVDRVQSMKFRAMAKLTTRMFAVSEAARALLAGAYGLDRRRIGVIENGVDTERFSASPIERTKNGRRRRFVVGTVGRLFQIKNLPLLLRAVRRTIDHGLDLELRIAGEGPEIDRLRALAEALGLDGRLSFSGHVDDVPAFLHELDLFALTSDSEGNPNALLEAMSTGRPCIATNVGNVPELFDGGRAGLMIPPNDEIGLCAGIEALYGDEGRRRALGEAAAHRIRERYSQSRMLAMYAALYRDPRGALLD